MKSVKKISLQVLFIVILFVAFFVIIKNVKEEKQKKEVSYTAEELGIAVSHSKHDEDHDGIVDDIDLCKGAQKYIASNPKYKSEYYEGGYPTNGYGVCTDVIWQAFKYAGYDLKAMVDEDISEAKKEYKIKKPDPNIDFRRVKNLNLYFKRHAESETTKLNQPEEWQEGDIVVFKNHIGICSDKRNKKGIPFLIHHNRKGAKEEDCLEKYKIVAHYRFHS